MAMTAAVTMDAAVTMAAARYRYPETERDAIGPLDLVINAGEWIGVIGPTNAGKSTLCYLVMGLAPHFFSGRLRGEVHVFGVETRRQPVPERSRRVGLLFQNPFTQLSGARERVDEEVAFGPENHGLARGEILERVDEALRLTGLHDLAARHPLDLSGGQLQRLALASLLAMRPELLLLDEPTSQLDPAGSRALFEVFRSLHQAGTTIIMVEHKLEAVAALCPRVIALADGRILADGSPLKVFNDPLVQATAGWPAYARLAQLAGLPAPLPVTFEAAFELLRG
jgi:energy-coupling factor transport system ATP-binding protein